MAGIRLSIILLLLFSSYSRADFSIRIDAVKDDFYQTLSGPDEGYLYIPHTDYLPRNGPLPDGDGDLSARVWTAWDSHYFYLYIQVRDDLVRVNNGERWVNDCLELKFDPDPTKRATAGIVPYRLTALDSAEAKEDAGVDNLHPDLGFESPSSHPENYARRLTGDGYVLELRLAWEWITIEGRSIQVGEGHIFGLAINFHDNDSRGLDGAIQWSAGMADEVWTAPQLLGTVEFLPNHRLKFIAQNAIDPTVSRGRTFLSLDRFATTRATGLELENWRYAPGDSMAWADPGFDDSDWEIVHSSMRPKQLPKSGWDGIGWFRIHLTVDSTLWSVPLALSLWQVGASEIYLNGRLLEKLGEVSASPDDEEKTSRRYPQLISLDRKHEQVIAVRYSNTEWAKFAKLEVPSGFNYVVRSDPTNAFVNLLHGVRRVSVYQILFTVVPFALALVHLLIYLFYPATRENLYFSLCMFGWAVISFTNFQIGIFQSYDQLLIIGRINIFVTLPTMVFGLLTVYTVFYRRLPKISYFFILVGLILSVVGTIFFVSRFGAYIFYGFIGLSALEILRVFILRGIRNGKWLTGVGFLMLMIFVVYQVLLGLQLVPMFFGIDIVYPVGVFILALTVSIDLSRAYRRTNKSLERQLVQVKELSEKTLIQERRAREEEIARKVLEAEVARKTEELEEARKLQLSMLPRTIPELPGLEIAASMTTATEVGGDYYDFIVTGEQTLTLAVGDATGHGMKAGTMVATIKGLFSAYGTHMDLIPFFHKCTDVIRGMHLGNLYMAMMLTVFRGKEMTVTSAGMPPALICRAESHEVEEILLKGMPLGGPAEYRYEQKTVELRSGDSILFMSDGFPELFNAEQEMFDYARVRDLFRSVAGTAPSDIISALNRAAAEWRGEHPQNDDMTFVAVRVRE